MTSSSSVGGATAFAGPAGPAFCGAAAARSGATGRSHASLLEPSWPPCAGRPIARATAARTTPVSISSAFASVSITRSRLSGFCDLRRQPRRVLERAGPGVGVRACLAPHLETEELDAAERAVDRLAQLRRAAARDQAVRIDAAGERRRRRPSARGPGRDATSTSTSASTQVWSACIVAL